MTIREADREVQRLATESLAVAFDISATAVSAARQRFPESRVSYRTVDLLSSIC